MHCPANKTGRQSVNSCYFLWTENKNTANIARVYIEMEWKVKATAQQEAKSEKNSRKSVRIHSKGYYCCYITILLASFRGQLANVKRETTRLRLWLRILAINCCCRCVGATMSLLNIVAQLKEKRIQLRSTCGYQQCCALVTLSESSRKNCNRAYNWPNKVSWLVGWLKQLKICCFFIQPIVLYLRWPVTWRSTSLMKHQKFVIYWDPLCLFWY